MICRINIFKKNTHTTVPVYDVFSFKIMNVLSSCNSVMYTFYEPFLRTTRVRQSIASIYSFLYTQIGIVMGHKGQRYVVLYARDIV